MEVVNAVVPNVPAGIQSSASGSPVNPGSPALAKGAHLATAGQADAGAGIAASSVAIDSAVPGVLFGMVLAQLSVVKETALKQVDDNETDAKTADAQISPDQMSMLASLVPAIVTLQVAPQVITVSRETSAAEASGLSSPPTLTSPVDLNAISITSQPALSTDPGKDPKSGQLHNQGLALDRTLTGAPQMSAATMAPISVSVPPALTQDQGQGVQTFMPPVSSAPELDNPSSIAGAHDTGLNAASLSALINRETNPDPSKVSPPPSLLVDAMLINKATSREDLLKGVLDDKNGSVLELAPAGSDQIPTEFLAGRSTSQAPSPAVTAPQLTAPISAPVALATITPRETIQFELGASDLGRVTVQVSVQSQQVQATVGVEHRGLGEFLAAGQVALDQAMRQHGLRLDEFHVESIQNPEMLGADGRTGFLDHGQSRQYASGFMSEPQAHQGPESEAIMAKADNILASLGARYRINLFA